MAELGGVSVRIRPKIVGDRDGLKYVPRRERLKLYELSDRVDKFYQRLDRDCHLGRGCIELRSLPRYLALLR